MFLQLFHCMRFVISAEFDDAELCTSLSRPSYGGVGNSLRQHGDSSQPNDLLVQDLRAQLSRCHKVIRGLQVRVRSLSATSDYASSLERTPRKVQSMFTLCSLGQCCLRQTILELYTYFRPL